MKILKAFMGTNSFLMVNKAMIREVGMEAAIFLSFLVDAYTIFETEWFFQTTPTIEGLSCGFLTRRKQENAIKVLVDKGMIEQKNMGLPMRKHFKINEEIVMEVFKNDNV